MTSQIFRNKPDAGEQTQAMIQKFIEIIQQEMLNTGDRNDIAQKILVNAAELEKGSQHLIVDSQAKNHVKEGAVVLAAFNQLSETIHREDLIAFLKRGFAEPFHELILSGTREFLDNSQDPFSAMVEYTKKRESIFFGTAFTFEHSRDDECAYYSDVTRCPWYDFFTENGNADLTPIFCDFDQNWIGAIDPARHRFCFNRATTLGYGGKLCPFHFFRLEPPARE